ncbi:exopolyphosphatase / guanosine-5'-triphosphate,3'-diphosphate pyrophosphatase [Sphingomonas sp. OV641]|uniref:Ppx/GppA family phosphatase n=1 Tax=Sphingomonas sp. OV641 TaxID=1881068 RepID=UPI0008ABF211|nr:Ppx/GppA family phosphatase [Sphingomonas sp. OV641]SEJ00484.1 exopolyphosphatase / guanosine-5'-triphosphate,3'-diphosphate pyrophosphatase [Sphingomonas sp. OV641]
MEGKRTAIVDIGSNSIRLVVYQGPPRLPAILFNEKVLAGLGRSLAGAGTIDSEAMEMASAALRRFGALIREMDCDDVRTVATAAVRDAANGADLIRMAETLGLSVELLSGAQEARAAGLGVLSAIPEADGIVGDLGGGSLELVRIAEGRVHEHVSFPLGVLRLEELRSKSGFARRVERILDEAGWSGVGRGKPLYLVGGSWRSLARVDIHDRHYPLPVLHGYAMPISRVDLLRRKLPTADKAWFKAVPNLSTGRVPTLCAAADLLGAILPVLGCSGTIVSAFGLREGLLYERLSPAEAALDPLVVAARDEGRQLGRFAEHGDLLNRWIAPLFDGEPERNSRLRHAACLLADTSWRANPEFRVELGIETALHGNWVGIDARGRAMMAAALAASLGAQPPYPAPIPLLAGPQDIATATAWGLAIRLAQRLSGGVAGPLHRTGICRTVGGVELMFEDGDLALSGEAVEKRLKALGAALGLPVRIGRRQDQSPAPVSRRTA